MYLTDRMMYVLLTSIIAIVQICAWILGIDGQVQTMCQVLLGAIIGVALGIKIDLKKKE